MIAFCPFASTAVYAQGAPSAGADMWTGAMALGNLFTPHVDFCDPATEAFVPVIFNLGYCIEKNERPAQQWEQARITCLQQLKRLPEVAEFQVACDSAATLGLNNMTNGLEWTSNFLISTHDFNTTAQAVMTSGDNDCNDGSTGRVSNSGTGQPVSSLKFRCVK